MAIFNNAKLKLPLHHSDNFTHGDACLSATLCSSHPLLPCCVHKSTLHVCDSTAALQIDHYHENCEIEKSKAKRL